MKLILLNYQLSLWAPLKTDRFFCSLPATSYMHLSMREKEDLLSLEDESVKFLRDGSNWMSRAIG